ncbi:MAG: hypothetical protein DRQ14_07930 [Candidatus Latescibacterota bacterium]|nr:MAG: hypothetical protein DRQ14_07930 [Candidatus Latescibacterota bacterium]
MCALAMRATFQEALLLGGYLRLPRGTAYIRDDGCHGLRWLCGVVVDLDEGTGRALKIIRLREKLR